MSTCHSAAVFLCFCYTHLLALTGANSIPALILQAVQAHAGILFSLAIMVPLLAYCLLKINRLSSQVKYQQVTIADQRLRLANLTEIIEQSGQNKADHIGHFVCLVSDYITKFEKLHRSVQRHIAVKNYRDILPAFNQINVKAERNALYRDFDRYFLKAFPHFVMEFNAMLKKEDQIWPKRIGDLNTELRIFALMKLGIADCDTIAGILEYSANTIYVYKMRIKAKFNLPAEETDEAATLQNSFIRADRYIKSA